MKDYDRFTELMKGFGVDIHEYLNTVDNNNYVDISTDNFYVGAEFVFDEDGNFIGIDLYN